MPKVKDNSGTKWHEHYEFGKKAFEEKSYDNALQHLEKVVEEKDRFPDVYNMLGVIYYGMNRYADAIKSFEKALNLNPRYTEALLNLSVAYNETGEYDKAQEVYSAARASRGKDKNTYLDPFVRGKLANMHAELGNIYKDLGYYKEAIDEYKRALALRPDFEDIITSLGIVYRDTKDYSKAIKTLEEAVNVNSDYVTAKIQLGLTYYTMGQFERAKAEWLKVLRKNPKDRLANMYLNLLKGRRG